MSSADSNSLNASYGHTEVKMDKSVFTWTIGNFSIWCYDMAEIREPLVSPTFSSGTNDKLKWYLVLDVVDEKQLSLYLHCKTPSVKVAFNFSILNLKKEQENVSRSTEVRHFGEKSAGWGYRCFINLNTLLNEAKDLLPGGKLTIVCEISEVHIVNITNPIDQPEIIQSTVTDDKLSEDFDDLFTNHEFSDVTFAVSEHEIKAHKTILAARSKVFAAMFEHKMVENKLSRVVITDIDHEVLNEMLRFMYIGKAPNLYEMTHGLLVAADKYALEDLKGMCENALNVTLSVETAVETLVSAHLYTTGQLKAQSIAFIKTHVTDVMQTQAWQDAIRAHPDLILEVSRAFGKQINP
ncbi:protein roadkill-like [Glossina fuscipes]|uniref:Protein roadkill-like n=1 Tax=Glossina fuscipes TaxID=7396 RepID=A0A9C5YXX7_9MUSC|nr:protein roadkill-like [Glossina fuscipes]